MKTFFRHLCAVSCLAAGLSIPVFGQVGISDNILGIAPQSLLHVHSNSATGNILQLTNNVSGNTMSYHGFAIKADPDFKVIFANQYGHFNAGFGFTTNVGGIQSERMTILNNGNVGISVNNPAQRFAVGGQFGLLETGVSPTLFTTLQSGDLSGAITFTLPNNYGASGQALVCDGLGNLSWSSRETPLTFSNGITRVGPAVKLGGALAENTTITQSGTLVLNFLNSGSANTLFNLTGTGDFDLQANGTSMLFGSSSGKIGIGTTSPSEMLTVLGDVSFNYTGAGNGLYGSGSCPYALGYFTNSYPGSTWGLSAGCSSASASSSSYGVMGFNSGSGYGLYGRSSNGYGAYGENITATNFGYLGGATYGVYGSCEGNSGYIGGSTNAIVGNHSNGNNGYLGGTDYGAFGYLATSGNGDYAVHGYGPHALSVDGTSYANINTLGGVKGLCYYGNPYTFGTAGYSYLDYFRSGGAFGSNYQGTLWGCMAY